MGLWIAKECPVLIGDAEHIAKLFRCAGMDKATEDEVDRFMAEEIAKGCAIKLESIYIHCNSPEDLKFWLRHREAEASDGE